MAGDQSGLVAYIAFGEQGIMDQHLERALIETFYAIAEFDALKATSDADQNEMREIGRILHATRGALEGVLDRSRQIQASYEMKISA
jgi:hypothetical protein